MRDVPLDPHTPAEEDPVVHRQLAVLEAFSPRPGLADRVLIHVRLPLPPWLRRARDRGRTLADSRRIWLVAAPFLVGATTTVVAALLLVATQPHMLSQAWGWFVRHGLLVAWHAALGSLAATWGAFVTAIDPLPFGKAGVTAVIAAATVFWLVCAWGLYRTLRNNAIQRNTFHAQR